MADLRFDGRVAIVTGAGQGLGRAHALDLAARGAKVVVNDLGGAVDGTGASSGPASDVAEEIRKSGGTAVPNGENVATAEGADAIVRTAISEFGRVDIVINNAGILRDKSFLKMTAAEFDAVLGVHLRGSFLVTHAAWPHLRAQAYGRVVMTSSPAGLFGSFGQANYASAKMGLIGLAKTLSIEGAKYGIKVNAIAPVAYTRMTADLFPPELADGPRARVRDTARLLPRPRGVRVHRPGVLGGRRPGGAGLRRRGPGLGQEGRPDRRGRARGLGADQRRAAADRARRRGRADRGVAARAARLTGQMTSPGLLGRRSDPISDWEAAWIATSRSTGA